MYQAVLKDTSSIKGHLPLAQGYILGRKMLIQEARRITPVVVSAM